VIIAQCGEHWCEFGDNFSTFVFCSPILFPCSTRTHTYRASIRGMIYLGACLIAGIRLARATHVNHRQLPTSDAINESVDLAHEIYNRVFRKVPERIEQK
jgi:hypothetical protein